MREERRQVVGALGVVADVSWAGTSGPAVKESPSATYVGEAPVVPVDRVGRAQAGGADRAKTLASPSVVIPAIRQWRDPEAAPTPEVANVA